jgi:hypothetical protein
MESTKPIACGISAFAEKTVPSRALGNGRMIEILHFPEKNSGKQQKQRAISLLSRPPERRQPRISAANE